MRIFVPRERHSFGAFAKRCRSSGWKSLHAWATPRRSAHSNNHFEWIRCLIQRTQRRGAHRKVMANDLYNIVHYHSFTHGHNTFRLWLIFVIRVQYIFCSGFFFECWTGRVLHICCSLLYFVWWTTKHFINNGSTTEPHTDHYSERFDKSERESEQRRNKIKTQIDFCFWSRILHIRFNDFERKSNPPPPRICMHDEGLVAFVCVAVYYFGIFEFAATNARVKIR